VKLDSNNEFGTELLLTLDSGPGRYIKDVNSRHLPFERSWKSFLDIVELGQSERCNWRNTKTN
jgi:hypothetical protein